MADFVCIIAFGSCPRRNGDRFRRWHWSQAYLVATTTEGLIIQRAMYVTMHASAVETRQSINLGSVPNYRPVILSRY